MERNEVYNQSKPRNWAIRFFTIWSGQALSLFGSALVQFALIWWLTQTTGSATVLAFASLASMLPYVLFGLFAGALVDRWNRRWVMILSDGSVALATLILVYLFATGQAQVWHIYTVLAIRSLGGAFHFPAMSASTPLMVPSDKLTRINGLNQTLQGLNGMVAPPVAALLISLIPTYNILMIDFVTAILAILPLLFISIPQQQRKETTDTKPSLLKDVGDGFVYLRSWPGLVIVLAMGIIVNGLLQPTLLLMPLLVTKYFRNGALELGFVNTSWGTGIIMGGVLLSVWGGFKRKIATTMMGVIGLGMGVVLVAFAPANSFALVLLGMFVGGMMSSVANAPLLALVQSIVKADMLGRVMSLFSAFASAITPISLLLAGPISDAIGIHAWFRFAGITTLLMGIGGYFSSNVMNMESIHEASERSEAGPVDPATS